MTYSPKKVILYDLYLISNKKTPAPRRADV